MKALTLEKDYGVKLSSKVVDYIYPDYIFIPMYEGYKLKVKNNELVKKEQMLLVKENGVGICSPISGRVVGAKECLLASGNLQKCIVIENDFKEKLESRATMRKNFNQISKGMFFDILEKNGAINAENPNFLLVNTFKNVNFNKIIVNGIEDEPYMATKLFLLQQYADEILEIMSFLARIFDIKDNIIVFKSNDRENIEKYTNILGTYPEIYLNVVPDIYPLEKQEFLLEYLKFDKDNTLVITPENLLVLYNTLKKNKRTTEKYITITGDAINNPIVVNAKIGSSVKKIIDENINYLNNDDVVYVANGLMRGCNLKIEDLIVTSEMNGIIINFKKEYQEYNCINCGKCMEVCPVSIDPKLCFINKKNDKDIDKCIECGLCTYICPVYINFKKRIKEIKNEK